MPQISSSFPFLPTRNLFNEKGIGFGFSDTTCFPFSFYMNTVRSSTALYSKYTVCITKRDDHPLAEGAEQLVKRLTFQKQKLERKSIIIGNFGSRDLRRLLFLVSWAAQQQQTCMANYPLLVGCLFLPPSCFHFVTNIFFFFSKLLSVSSKNVFDRETALKRSETNKLVGSDERNPPPTPQSIYVFFRV